MLGRQQLERSAAHVADDSLAAVNHQKFAERREEGGAIVERAQRPLAVWRRRGAHVEIIGTWTALDNGGQAGGEASAVRHPAGSQRSIIRAPCRSRSGMA